MEHTDSPDYVCKLDAEYGEFSVYRKQPAILRETRIENGQVTVSEMPVDQHPTLKALASIPLFRGNYRGEGYYNIDLDCGFQRWNGSQSGQAVSKSFSKCGFTPVQVKSILAMARKQTNRYIYRCG